MDFKRLSLAAIVAWFVCTMYGIVVQILVMGAEFEKYPAIFRSESAINAKVPLMLGGNLLAMFALAYIYAKGYEGGNGTLEGIRFGFFVALFIFGFASIGIYGSIDVGSRIAVVSSATTFIEMVLAGVVVGTLYKPPRTEANT
jgi:hypothetical protein